ncbi:MAG: SBBP repeat-containing protein [Acidobacteriota bacterium]|nr:SBBP repeat-containing protein [Blastocatellia bacterium]MDW8412051.1 SBBP repeat-containing protein [Acidobacteriota bacterium]
MKIRFIFLIFYLLMIRAAFGQGHFEQRGGGFYYPSWGHYFGKSEVLLSENATMRLLGARPIAPIGIDEQTAKINLFLGSDPSKWQVGLKSYARVKYEQLYKGVDLIFYVSDVHRRLKYDFIIAAGADPRQIVLSFDAVTVKVGEKLRVETSVGKFLHQEPYAYQVVNGRTIPVSCKYVFREGGIGFDLGTYDPTKTLIIDPEISFSTHLGGSDIDLSYDVIVDTEGATYVVGVTRSDNFPMRLALQSKHMGSGDAFVSKYDAKGRLVFSTYFGGEALDEGRRIRIDQQGNLIIVGETSSDRFPVVNSLRERRSGLSDLFIAKLSSDGKLLYSTYYGGSQADFARGLDVAPDGRIYVTGFTASADFPLNNPFQASIAGNVDAFLFALSTDGRSTVYSTYLGGRDIDEANSVSVDAQGQAAIVGFTRSNNFPVTASPTSSLDDCNGFLARFSATGTRAFAAYVGGSGCDELTAVKLASDGTTYVCGSTASLDIPITRVLASAGGQGDVLIQAYDTSGTLVYSTVLGGSSSDYPFALDSNPAVGIAIVGSTFSSDFPLINPFQSEKAGLEEGFFLATSVDNRRLEFSTFIGGADNDLIRAVAFHKDGAVSIGGLSSSGNFPVVNAEQPALGGNRDAVVMKFRIPDRAPTVNVLRPAENAALTIGLQANIAFEVDDGGKEVSSVAASFSVDDGATFTPIGVFSGSVRAVAWRVPEIFSEAGRVKIEVVDSAGNVGVGVSDRFRIVPVQVQGPAYKVRVEFDPPPAASFLPPQNVRVSVVILGDKPPLSPETPLLMTEVSAIAQQTGNWPTGYRIYRLAVPAGSNSLPTAQEIVKPENLLAFVPRGLTSWEEIAVPTATASGNYAYSLTSTFGSGQESPGSPPAGTNVPQIINPMFDKGTIFLDLAGSFISTSGAKLVVNHTEMYSLVPDSSGMKFTVSKKELSSPGKGMKIKKAIKKNTTSTLMVFNPNGTRSITKEFTRK